MQSDLDRIFARQIYHLSIQWYTNELSLLIFILKISLLVNAVLKYVKLI
jgi:hypothetical protein